MRDLLQTFYESELNYIRRLALEFARDRPKIADRLYLDTESGQSDDPHVERLIEAFAFLTARIRVKLEDDFPELTDALLSVLYPHYLAPVPSMAIAQFDLDPMQAKLAEGYSVPVGSRLYSREVQGIPCRFRTAYPVRLWPVELISASYHTAPWGTLVNAPARSARSPAVLRLELKSVSDLPLHQLQMDSLRFFLNGDSVTTRTLFELIFNHVTQVLVRPGSAQRPPSQTLDASALKMVGFGADEGLLPYGARSLLGYRLLTEYFSFPAKFLFFDITGLQPVIKSGFTDRLEIFLFLDQNVAEMESRVDKSLFRLGCTPIVNLFKQEADPIRLTQAKYEYQVIPDVRHPRALEVYSIDRVFSTDLQSQQTREFRPFYALKHADGGESDEVYWYGRRAASLRQGDAGTAMFLSLADAGFNPRLPASQVLSVETTCTNRDLPAQLRVAGGQSWSFQLEGQAPFRSITPLVGPTPPQRFAWDQTRWRLVSHLTLNHLSLLGEEDAAEPLRELLKLYDHTADRATTQHIQGIRSVQSRRCVAPIHDGVGRGFCRGVEVTVDFDEELYTGSGLFLFSAVLEQFFGLYTTINTPVRMVARTRQRTEPLRKWPFRVGQKWLV